MPDLFTHRLGRDSVKVKWVAKFTRDFRRENGTHSVIMVYQYYKKTPQKSNSIFHNNVPASYTEFTESTIDSLHHRGRSVDVYFN